MEGAIVILDDLAAIFHFEINLKPQDVARPGHAQPIGVGGDVTSQLRPIGFVRRELIEGELLPVIRSKFDVIGGQDFIGLAGALSIDRASRRG